MIVEQPRAPSANARIVKNGGKSSALDVFKATWDATRNNDLLDSHDIALEQAYDRRNAKIKSATGVDLPNPVRDRIPELAQQFRARLSGASSAPSAIPREQYLREQSNWYENKVNDLRLSRPDAVADIPDGAAMDAEMKSFAHALEAKMFDLNSRAGFGAKAAGFGGGVAAGMTDTINIVTLPIGGAGKTVLGTAARSGAANAAIETFSQPFIQEFRGEQGLEHGFMLGARNVAFAGVGGAVLGGGFHALGKAPAAIDNAVLKLDPGRWAGREMNKMLRDIDPADMPAFLPRADLLARFNEKVKEPTPFESQVRHEVEQDIALDAASPIGKTPDKLAEHRQRVQNIAAGEPVAPLRSPVVVDDVPTGFRAFAPSELIVDAKRFQFKSGGDAKGVTERLKDVKQWDPVKAGLIVAWEDKAGKLFIADGHQRRGLAERIAKADPSQNIRLYGPVLREADGISATQARAIAAMKNLAEGTGSAIDAAKVLRADPKMLDDTVSRQSAVMRQAQDMQTLGDDAFMMVVNEIVPTNYGAIVGRLAADQRELQTSLMKLIKDTAPENVFQAESIIRQALAGPVKKEVQENLFGSEEIVRALFKERAKILDLAIKRLKRDSNIFKTLVRDEKTILKGGDNRLDRAQNLERATEDAQATEIIQKLTTRKGDISDALDQAARAFADGTSAGKAAGDFVAVVRNRFKGGNGLGDRPSAAGRATGAAPADIKATKAKPEPRLEPRSEPSQQSSLDDFSNPVSAEVRSQTDALESRLKSENVEGDRAVPVGEEIDADGVRQAKVMDGKEADAAIKQDDDMLDFFNACKDGGAL